MPFTFSRRALLGWVIFSALLLAPLAADLSGTPYIVNLVTRFVIYGLAAVSLDLVLGYGAMVSFGHAMFFGLGGYVVAIISFHTLEAGPLFGWSGSQRALVVWPIAIALCTTFFGNRFSESERKSGITNYIMGLSFITEGASPFAAADPLRVIPSCIVGSATAGALSMAFGCTLRAPHGGILVVPTIGNPMMYLVAILIGAAVGMILLALLKKPVTK